MQKEKYLNFIRDYWLSIFWFHCKLFSFSLSANKYAEYLYRKWSNKPLPKNTFWQISPHSPLWIHRNFNIVDRDWENTTINNWLNGIYFASWGINNTRGYNIQFKVRVFFLFFFFFVQLVENIFPNILLEMIDAAPLETIVDEDEEGDSDIEID